MRRSWRHMGFLGAGPLAPLAARYAAAFSVGMTVAGMTAGGIRLLPWVLDPSVSWRVTVPFARALAELALEAAILLGWPLGWSLAAIRLVESGESRVLALLGERPARTASRLAPQGIAFSVVLAAVSLLGGRDASEPGRIVTELVTQARLACEKDRRPTTYSVPFLGATWLCTPQARPRLVGQAPPAFGGMLFTAVGASIAGDFRRIELEDARLAIPGGQVHVGVLDLHGLPPFARGLSLPPAWRAFGMVLSGGVSAWLSAYLIVRGFVRGRLAVLALGASGPLSALGCLRLLERTDAGGARFFLLPLSAGLATAVCAFVAWRLPRRRATASK